MAESAVSSSYIPTSKSLGKTLDFVTIFLTGRPGDHHLSPCNRSSLVSNPQLKINLCHVMSKKVLQLHPNKHKFYFSNEQSTPTTFICVQILQCCCVCFSLLAQECLNLRSSPQLTYTKGFRVPWRERVVFMNG